jgi:host factor-I protein
MGKSGMNLQDSFLNQVRKDNTEIMVVLLDGTRLIGYVRGFDNFTVIMNARGQQHLIYKHAIAQIVSRRPTMHVEGGEIQAEEPAREQDGPQEGSASEEPRPREERPREERPREERPREARPREDRPRREDSRRRDRDESHRRDEAQRKEEAQRKDKFNTIDLSSLKVNPEEKS